MPKEDKVFEETPLQTVDIGAMVSARLKAARRLESNPHDVEALSIMHKAQTQIRNWTVGKQKPGMFTGDTGIRTLRPEELANSDPKAQAWAKKVKWTHLAVGRLGDPTVQTIQKCSVLR
jgi:hypothetical protein